MGLFLFCSGKGAPGVTTVATATAARWDRTAEPLLVECDPAGGDLAARFQLVPAPGLASAVADTSTVGVSLGWHSQPLPIDALPALLAPASDAAASVAVQAAVDTGILTRAAGYRPVIVDAGRLQFASPALGLAKAADVVVVMSGDRIDDLAHAAATIDLLRQNGAADVRLLLRLRGGIPARRIAAELHIAVVGDVPSDATGAQILSGRAAPGRAWTRLPLARVGRTLALVLAAARDHPADPVGVLEATR